MSRDIDWKKEWGRRDAWWRFARNWWKCRRYKSMRTPSPWDVDRIRAEMAKRCQVTVLQTIGGQFWKRVCMNERPCAEHEVVQ